jgi:glycosyltransferase involved in cell wall biosynthesis
VSRCLSLKGTYESGFQLLQDLQECRLVDEANQYLIRHWLRVRDWDGFLLGNLDLLGPEILPLILAESKPIVHHVGFVTPPPYPAALQPREEHYKILAASQAVRSSLISYGFGNRSIPVVYPGARVDLFEHDQRNKPIMPNPKGTSDAPLKLCFAGLIMATKGVHTLVEALISLHQEGIRIQANLAGATFGARYREQLERHLASAGLEGEVCFVGQLNRTQLARFLRLHHCCVFPSIHPEAFGIVGAEAMVSGVALISSGVGGARELIEDGRSGLLFEAGNSLDLCRQIKRLILEPGLLERLRQNGECHVRSKFSVEQSVRQLEDLLTC